jgi:hypothetical protein
MGRIKIETDKKKKSISVAMEPEILQYIRVNHINLSSLVNKLLKDYIENGGKQMSL